MFWLLLKTRIRGSRNSGLDWLHRNRLLALVLALLSLVMFLAVGTAFLVFFRIAEAVGVLGEALRQTLFFLLLFLLTGATSFVAPSLLQTGEYLLLYSAPALPRAVVSAKLLDATVASSLQFIILGVPAIGAALIVRGAPLAIWCLALPLMLMLALIPALCTSLALLIAIGALGAQRVRGAIAIANGISGALVGMAIVSQVGGAAAHAAAAFSSTSLPAALAAQPLAVAQHGPSAWIASILLASGPESSAAILRNGGLLVALSLMLLGACIVLGERLLTPEALDAAAGSSDIQLSAPGGVLLERLLGRPAAAILRKDARCMLRDTVLLPQLLMPMLLLAVPILIRHSGQHMDPGDAEVVLFGIVAGLVFMQTSILSLSLMGLEGPAFWILRAAPHRGATILRAKWMLSTAITGALSTGILVAGGIAEHIPIGHLLGSLAICATACAALCGLGVGLSATFPKFFYDNPAMRVTFWAMTLDFWGSGLFFLFGGGLAVTGWMLSAQEGAAPFRPMLWGGVGLGYMIACAGSALLPMAVGSRRIEGYEWTT